MLTIIDYRSVRDTAEEFGVTKWYIYQLLNKNRLHKLPTHEKYFVVLYDESYQLCLRECRRNKKIRSKRNENSQF